MGMFDYVTIKSDAPLANGFLKPGVEYQTKDLVLGLCMIEIGEDMKLSLLYPEQTGHIPLSADMDTFNALKDGTYSTGPGEGDRLNIYYGDCERDKDIYLDVKNNQITAVYTWEGQPHKLKWETPAPPKTDPYHAENELLQLIEGYLGMKSDLSVRINPEDDTLQPYVTRFEKNTDADPDLVHYKATKVSSDDDFGKMLPRMIMCGLTKDLFRQKLASEEKLVTRYSHGKAYPDDCQAQACFNFIFREDQHGTHHCVKCTQAQDSDPDVEVRPYPRVEAKYWDLLNDIPTYSFLNLGGGVKRTPDSTGRYVELADVQALISDIQTEYNSLRQQLDNLKKLQVVDTTQDGE